MKSWHITFMGYTTKKSLLEAIQNGDEVSWFEFYETYRPLMILRGGDYRLSPEEVEELCQEVLLDVFKTGRRFRYDPSRGRFRDYLRTVISHNAVDLIRKRTPCEAPTSAIVEYSDTVLDEHWREEWRNHILNQALVILRTRIELVTYQAFDLYALKGEQPGDVAKFLNISISMVYVAKNRAMTKLRKIVKELRED